MGLILEIRTINLNMVKMKDVLLPL